MTSCLVFLFHLLKRAWPFGTPLEIVCAVNFAFDNDVDVKSQSSLFAFSFSPLNPSPQFYRAISMRIFAVFAEKVGSCWCVTHVHVFITWTVWTRLWKPFPRACGSVPNVKTRYCLTDSVIHCKDFSKLKKTITSLGLFISRQPDTEQIYLICNKACVNLIWLTSVGMRASAKPLSFPPGLEVFICYPCVFPLSGLKHTNFWERFSTTHRNFPVHPKLVVS